MRCAIVHYWLLGMRGGEKVVEALCRLYPQADIFTLFYDPESVSPLIRSHHVTASFLNPFRKHYRSLLPLMPMALEHLDLRDYDLIISSESGPAQRDYFVFPCPPYLLLSFAHALSLGSVSGISARMDTFCLEASVDD